MLKERNVGEAFFGISALLMSEYYFMFFSPEIRRNVENIWQGYFNQNIKRY